MGRIDDQHRMELEPTCGRGSTFRTPRPAQGRQDIAIVEPPLDPRPDLLEAAARAGLLQHADEGLDRRIEPDDVGIELGLFGADGGKVSEKGKVSQSEGGSEGGADLSMLAARDVSGHVPAPSMGMPRDGAPPCSIDGVRGPTDQAAFPAWGRVVRRRAGLAAVMVLGPLVGQRELERGMKRRMKNEKCRMRIAE